MSEDERKPIMEIYIILAGLAVMAMLSYFGNRLGDFYLVIESIMGAVVIFSFLYWFVFSALKNNKRNG
jgi:hypothetical protein